MKDWILNHLKEHGDRHVFTLLALMLITAIHIWIPELRPQVDPLYVIIIGLWLNKIRTKRDNGEKEQV